MQNAYHDFRLFYNQNIHPELLHLEQRRLRLLRLLAVSGVLMAGVAAMQIFINIFVVTLLLLIPVGVWMSYLLFRVQVFYKEFKPRIVGLILDFIDNDVNFSFEGYDAKGSIDKKSFLESRIFTVADDYAGEDLIRGQVRETPFELCELRVHEFSPARNKLDRVFRGVFLIGDYKRWDLHGGVLVLPDTYRKYLSRSERAFHLVGGRRVKDNLLPEFEAFFDTYATSDIKIHEVISEDMQRAMLKFREQFLKKNRQKEIYFSIIADKIYIALTQDKDLLEPSLFRSNANFDSISEFYSDIHLLLQVVLDVDVMN
jgi:hypothetical protein